MRNLTDPYVWKHYDEWGPAAAPRWWREFAAALIFAAFGLAVCVLAVVKSIPIGEYVLWNG
jgi:hypothetical protein